MLSSTSGISSPSTLRRSSPVSPEAINVEGDVSHIPSSAPKMTPYEESMSNSAAKTAKAASDTLELTKKGNSAYTKGQMALAGAEFLIDVANANNQYEGAKGQARMNITMARNNAADAISRGHQAQLDRQSEGYNAGQDALLAAAAQGQDVGGAGVQKIQGSYEAIGIENGMREEINSMREALGYELEEIDYNRQVEMARINRNNALIGSTLSLGVKAATYGAM